MTDNNPHRLVATTLMAIMLLSIGCVNLDKNEATHGQTFAKSSQLSKRSKLLKQASQRRHETGFMAAVKNVMPKPKPRTMMDTRPVVMAKNDPSSLAYVPKQITPDLYTSAAGLSQRNGRFKQAIDQYQKALQIDGQNRSALIGLARLHQRTGNGAAAINMYSKAHGIYPNDPVVMNDLGLCYARNGQLKEAVSVLRRATQAAPEREMYLNNLAAVLVESGRAGEAVSHLSHVHDSATASYRVGYLLDRNGDTDAARPYLTRALALNPSMQQARLLLRNAGGAADAMQQENGNYDNTNGTHVASAPHPVEVAQRPVSPYQPVSAEPAATQVAPPTNAYEIPVTEELRTGQVRYPAPNRTSGKYPAVAPTESTPEYLLARRQRYGQFGFAPNHQMDTNIQLVVYVEQGSNTTPVPAAAKPNVAELTPVDTPVLFPLRMPAARDSNLGGVNLVPTPSTRSNPESASVAE